jgi:lipoyl(octanoyl) transferase
LRRALAGVWLGRRPYLPVLGVQERLHAARREDRIGDTVLFVEHEPVVTMGRGAHREHLLVSEQELGQRGIDLVEIGRGGDVTLHAPGQLVCYPILDLGPDRRDVRRYVGDLAETMRRVAADFGVDSGTADRLIGLWVDRALPARWSGIDAARDPAKLGAIGVRISRWVTMHGYALNLAPDLDLYRVIVPCGIRDFGVTSIEAVTGNVPEMRPTAERALSHLAECIDAEVRLLHDATAAAAVDTLVDDIVRAVR